MMKVEIEDTGIGLSDKAMESLFSPFQQAQRLSGGTGLGLYSLAQRLNALQGTYGVTRRKDGLQGSLFWFAIPYRPDSLTAEAVSGDESPGSNRNLFKMVAAQSVTEFATPPTDEGKKEVKESKANESIIPPEPPFTSHANEVDRSLPASAPDIKRKLTILLVDDSISILKLTGMMLTRQGFDVTKAENGSEALLKMSDQLKRHGVPFDAVLMDFQMPVMDGLETTRRLRASERTCQCRFCLEKQSAGGDAHDRSQTPRQKQCSNRHFVIGVSANSDDDTLREAYEAGVDTSLPKPFSLTAFMEVYLKNKSPTVMNKI